MLSRRLSKDTLPNTPCVKCRRLESKIRAVMLSGVPFPLPGCASAGVAPLPPRFSMFLDVTVKTFILVPSCKQLLDCDDKCMLSDPVSVKHE